MTSLIQSQNSIARDFSKSTQAPLAPVPNCATATPFASIRLGLRLAKLRNHLKPGRDPDPICDKCKGGLKDKPVIGMTILNNLIKKNDKWSDGTILDPNNGKTYKCYVEVIENGEKLKVRGFIGLSLLGRTQYWNKVPKPE